MMILRMVVLGMISALAAVVHYKRNIPLFIFAVLKRGERSNSNNIIFTKESFA